MKISASKYVLTDAGFWIDLIDKSQKSHEKSTRIFEIIMDSRCPVILPWPILYDVIRAKFMKKFFFAQIFEKSLKKINISYFDDSKYRDDALKQTLELLSDNKRKISLVDMVVRLILDDEKVRVDYIITSDERHFTDVCSKQNIPILNHLI